MLNPYLFNLPRGINLGGCPTFLQRGEVFLFGNVEITISQAMFN